MRERTLQRCSVSEAELRNERQGFFKKTVDCLNHIESRIVKEKQCLECTNRHIEEEVMHDVLSDSKCFSLIQPRTDPSQCGGLRSETSEGPGGKPQLRSQLQTVMSDGTRRCAMAAELSSPWGDKTTSFVSKLARKICRLDMRSDTRGGFPTLPRALFVSCLQIRWTLLDV